MERNTAGTEEVALLEQSIEDMKAGKILFVQKFGKQDSLKWSMCFLVTIS